ncbi:MAG: hypothetical protein AAFX80_00170 [Cyanobacteria bacterium J06639_18]
MIENLAKNAKFTHDKIWIDINASEQHLDKIAIAYELRFALWASMLGKASTVLRTKSTQIEIPANFAIKIRAKHMTSSIERQANNLLWFADVEVNPQLLNLAVDLIENPGKKGIVRLRDERQVILHDECKFSLLGKSTKVANNWSRPQYWYPAHLDAFRRECQQVLNDDGSNTLEYTYWACDADLGLFNREPGNWREFTAVYSLYDGGDGEYYQIAQNLGVRELVDAPVI